MRNVEMMQLSHNRLGNQGVAALSAMLRKRPLTCLFLVGCEIGDEGVASLFADLGKDDFKSLEMLELDHNDITDAGTTTLIAAIDAGRLPKLQQQQDNGLHGNPASAAALKAVQDALSKRSSMSNV